MQISTNMPDKLGANISVVIQGPVVGLSTDPLSERWTYQTIQSVRRHLPKAEIILSTWNETDTVGLDYDILVLNEDPGGWLMHIDGQVSKISNNVNRQIVSTKNGIESVTRSYILKMRSDVILTGNNFLEYFGVHKLRCSEYCILKQRVLCLNSQMSLRNELQGTYYHICDWHHFGLKEDIYNIWNIPLMKSECLDYNLDLAPEQYIWSSFIKKFYDIKFERRDDNPDNCFIQSLLSVVNNLVIIDSIQFNIKSFKYKNASYCTTDFRRFNYSTYNDWKMAYKKFCKGNVVISVDKKEIVDKVIYMIYKPMLKLYLKVDSQHIRRAFKRLFYMITFQKDEEKKQLRGDEIE